MILRANLLAAAVLGLCGLSNADFVYTDFNETTGIQFNGASGTTNCYDYSNNRYGDLQGVADVFDIGSTDGAEISELTGITTESTVTTNLEADNFDTTLTKAGFGHRPEQVSSPSSCDVRARLTPSAPSKTGSFWFKDPTFVLNGFETQFTFQISDQSKECVVSKDQYLSTLHHETCAVVGADGFGFCIQNQGSGDSTHVTGQQGDQMGIGGISNSICVAFDTWQNQGQDTMNSDHISIQAMGPNIPNDALEKGLLGVPRPYPLADGSIHLVQIKYYDYLKPDYFGQLIASPSLLPFLKDNGVGKRIGTLTVSIDGGVAADEPILALPINLSLVVAVPDGRAFVGFTGSTGRFYQKQDILSWVYCDNLGCNVEDGKISKDKDRFDYHQQSKFYSAPTRYFEPGPGFGSGGGYTEFPIKHTSPDSSPWYLPKEHFSKGMIVGLASDAGLQVPSATLY